MRVAIVSNCLSDLGGTEATLFYLTRALAESGHRVSVFHWSSQGRANAAWRERLRALDLSITEFDQGQSAEGFSRLFWSRMGTWKPDLVHVVPAGKFGLELARSREDRIPVIATLTSWPDPRCGWIPRGQFDSAAGLEAIIVPVRSMERCLRDYLEFRGRIFVVPPLVPSVQAASASAGADLFHLGSVSRLRYEKGPEFMIAVLSLLVREDPRYRLTIYGASHELQRCSDVSRALGVAEKVTLPGPFRSELDLDLIAGRHRLFLLGSLFECAPLSILELCSRGRVTVATSVGGVPDLVAPVPDAALLVPPGDPGAMATAVRRLVGSPEDLSLREALARQLYEKAYDPAVTLGRLERAYTELVA